MKPYGKQPVADRDGTRPTDTITGTENDFTAKSVEEWERRVFIAATIDGGHFTVWKRRPGVAGQGDTQVFDSFVTAALEAFHDPTKLVYAVAPSGRSFCVVRKQWSNYLELYKSLQVP